MKNAKDYFKLTLSIFQIVIVGLAGGVTEVLARTAAEGEEAPQILSWSGYYVKQSEWCTSPGSGQDCSGEFHDCLKVEAASQGYIVELYSTQANQHVCAFTFNMDADNNMLVYKAQLGSVFLKRNGDSLMISSKGINSTALGLGVCGAHADIDGLKFPLINKSNTAEVCPSSD